MTTSRSLRTLSVAALVALGIALLPAIGAQAAGEDDVVWMVRTASNEFGADRTSYNYTINPGSTISDAMEISNDGSSPLDLAVYAADGYTTDSGQFDLVVGGAKSTNIGIWVTGASDHVTVNPGETVAVPFTVSVPENATPGDYAGGIVTSLTQPDDEAQINVDRRLGIRIALRVSGDLVPSLAVENLQVAWDGGFNPFATGDATISYSIKNTGNAVLSAQQAATLTGPFGLFPNAINTLDDPPRLLPGESWKVSVPVRNVPASVLLLTSASVTPIVIDASGSTNALEPIVVTAVGWAVPWLLIIIGLALAALVVLLLQWRKRRSVQQQAREDARVQEAVEQALADKESEKVPVG